MAKQSGLGDRFFAQGWDLSGDVNSLGRVASPRGTLEIPGINSSAMERLLTHCDGVMAFNTWFNDQLGVGAHIALRGLPTTARLFMYCRGSTAGAVCAMLNAFQMNYDPKRGEDGSLAIDVEAQGTGGTSSLLPPLEWGKLLTAGKVTHASSTASASVDDSAGTSNGIVAQLQVFDIASGTPTVVVEHSTDNSVWATKITFAAVADGSEPTAEQKTASGTVNRYLRASTINAFTNCTFAVGYRRGTAEDIVAYA